MAFFEMGLSLNCTMIAGLRLSGHLISRWAGVGRGSVLFATRDEGLRTVPVSDVGPGQVSAVVQFGVEKTYATKFGDSMLEILSGFFRRVTGNDVLPCQGG